MLYQSEISTSETEDRDINNELQKALIDYAVLRSRLLFIQKEETWKDFHSVNDNLLKYSDLTAMELCTKFIEHILPNIYVLELVAEVKQQFKLLDYHPEFVRTLKGYERLPAEQRVAAMFPVNDVIEFTNRKELSQKDTNLPPNRRKLLQPFRLDPPDNQSHIMIIRLRDRHIQRGGAFFQNSPATAALLSACLLSDQELSGYTLLTPTEVHERLRQAKRNFENTGQLRPFRGSGNKILKDIKEFGKLRQAFINIVSNRYSN